MSTPGGSARFFRLAERTFAFRGVMQSRVMQEVQSPSPTGSPAPSGKTKSINATAQRVNLRGRGAETRAVKLEHPSYLHELLREQGKQN